MADAGDGRAEFDLVIQSEQIHAGFGGIDQVGNREMGRNRNRNKGKKTKEEKGRGQNDLRLNSATRSIYGDVDKHNLLFATVPTLGHVAHQMGVKNMVKTAFLTGLACELAESLGKHTELHIQEMLGEMISYLEMVKAVVIAAEAQAVPGPQDSLMPDRDTLFTMRTLYPRLYPRMIEILRTIGGGADLLMTLGQDELRGPLAHRLAPYFRGDHRDVERHVRLTRLAWEVVGDNFGSRQLLYERLYAGDPIRNMAGRYLSYDKSHCYALVQRLLDNDA